MMKWFFLLLFVSCGIRIYGDEAIIKSKNFHVHVGANGFWSHGKFANSNARWSNDLFLIGPQAEFEFRKPRGYYFDADGVYAVGNYHMDAKYHFGKKLKVKKRATWFKGDLGFGYTFQPSYSPSFLLSIYAGPGFFRSKTDDWMNRWFYWQFGFKASQDWHKLLNVGIDFSGNYAVLHDSFWGIELGIPFTCYLGESRVWDIRIKPYLLKLNINSGDTILGARLEAGYSF